MQHANMISDMVSTSYCGVALAMIGNRFFNTPKALSMAFHKDECLRLNNSLGFSSGCLEYSLSDTVYFEME